MILPILNTCCVAPSSTYYLTTLLAVSPSLSFLNYVLMLFTELLSLSLSLFQAQSVCRVPSHVRLFLTPLSFFSFCPFVSLSLTDLLAEGGGVIRLLKLGSNSLDHFTKRFMQGSFIDEFLGSFQCTIIYR